MKSTFVRYLADTTVVKRILAVVRHKISPGNGSGNLWRCLRNWLWMQIFYLTCGFGERPSRVVLFSLSPISIFSLIYYFLITTPMTPLQKIANAIYLSLDCFVALGTFQNDIIPFSWRWLTYVEAGLGVALISLFLVVFIRKMTRD